MSIDYSTWQIELKSGSDTRVDNVREILEDDAGLTKLFDREGRLIFMAPTDSVSFMKCLQKPGQLMKNPG